MFESAHPCGCDIQTTSKPTINNSFNSRTRVGATGLSYLQKLDCAVSIHAPVWVRPVSVLSKWVHVWVSIHAPVWVRRLGVDLDVVRVVFQFTHPCGCDCFRPVQMGTCLGFNSRTRVGATLSGNMIPSLVSFQFTHPCGCDVQAPWVRAFLEVSIHAPVWVRLHQRVQGCARDMFQFTHPCGCDTAGLGRPRPGQSFNSRTRVGATYCRGCGFRHSRVSIHAPVWVRRPDEYGLSIKHATKVLRQPDARTRCGQA